MALIDTFTDYRTRDPKIIFRATETDGRFHTDKKNKLVTLACEKLGEPMNKYFSKIHRN